MTEFEPKPEIVNEPLPEPDTREQDNPKDGEICVHEIRPEIMKRPFGIGPDAMRLRIIGHKVGEPEGDEEIFSLVTAVPNAAIFASRMLEESVYSSAFTQMITKMALEREDAEATKRHDERANKIVDDADGDPMAALMALFGGILPEGASVQLIPLNDLGEPEEGDGTEAAPAKGYAREANRDDPVRKLRLDDSGMTTWAPVDNRSDYPDDMGGYL